MSAPSPRPLTTLQIHTYYIAFELRKYGVEFGDFYDRIRDIDNLYLEVATESRTKADSKAQPDLKASAAIPKYVRPQ